MSQETHTISFDVAADDGQRVTAVVTMDNDDNVLDVAGKDSHGNTMELSNKDRDILRNYAMMMVNSARKKIHERQAKEQAS